MKPKDNFDNERTNLIYINVSKNKFLRKAQFVEQPVVINRIDEIYL